MNFIQAFYFLWVLYFIIMSYCSNSTLLYLFKGQVCIITILAVALFHGNKFKFHTTDKCYLDRLL